MAAVVEAVTSAVSSVGNAVGSVVEAAGHVADQVITHVVQPVAQAVTQVVEQAAEDPVRTIATVAAIATGNPQLIPLINATATVAQGGSIEDGLKAAAISYVAGEVGAAAGKFGSQIGTAAEYGTQAGSQQTAMLAAQNAGMGSVGNFAANVIGNTAAGIVEGQDPLDALISSGVFAGTSAVTSQIDGFSDLSPAVQNSVKIAVASTLQGGDPSNALVNAAFNAGIDAIRSSKTNAGDSLDQFTGSESLDDDEGPGGIKDRIYDEFIGAQREDDDDGLSLIAKSRGMQFDQDQDQDQDGVASLKRGDGKTFVEKMSDGSEIVTDENGKVVGFRSATQVAFEEQAKPGLEGKSQDEMTPQDWADMYAMPTTNPETGETIVGKDPSDYPVQDFGDVEFDGGAFEWNRNAGWTPNEDGTSTYVFDDGSTITTNEDGDITHFTEATDTPYSEKKETQKKKPEPNKLLDNLYLNFMPEKSWNPFAVIPFAAGFAAANQDSAEEEQMRRRVFGLDWNQQGVNSLVDGAAYGQEFFDPRFTETLAAKGGLMSLAAGGQAGAKYDLGSYSDGGRLLRGPGDGMSDNIPATIGHKQPARLADGEFVVPADVVSHLGNGSTEAGSKVLYKMMDKVRRARTGNSKQGKQINPNKFVPR
jgi:hypothetical protein